ncbi:MAG: hypothetical protein JNJ73_10395 [Hyphomonadaceae bacterium]|nr:hypothetical protein [Hyphomonadaceae bacterium]
MRSTAIGVACSIALLWGGGAQAQDWKQPAVLSAQDFRNAADNYLLQNAHSNPSFNGRSPYHLAGSAVRCERNAATNRYSFSGTPYRLLSRPPQPVDGKLMRSQLLILTQGTV